MPLAPYATREATSAGRLYPVTPSPDRTGFQRDYARVLHSQAFRRLQQKTQVFSANLGDLFRTRITHSLEVDQLARTVARRLNLNEDLCGVLAIAHDIGHAPFGHMGQDLLNQLMGQHGGFEHNLQALRLVDEIESPYPEHHGLNLMFETREGLLKHCTPERARLLGEVAARHLDGRNASLEAQVVDWSDAIAYVHADLEDAFVMGVLSAEQLQQAPGYLEAWERCRARLTLPRPPSSADVNAPDPETARVASATVRSVLRDMMTHAVEDLVATSAQALATAAPDSAAAARQGPALVGFSPAYRQQHSALKRFSREWIYGHPNIQQVRQTEERILEGLFRAFEAEPSLLPGPLDTSGGTAFYRRLADHLSGMTDRYAVEVFEQIRRDRPNLLPARCRDARQASAAHDRQCYPQPSSVSRGTGRRRP